MEECQSQNINVCKGLAMKHFSLFDSKETESFICHKEIKILSDKTMVLKSTKDAKRDGDLLEEEELSEEKFDFPKDGKSCSLCGIKFAELEEQRAHFKLDWHKFNVKQMLLQRDTVKEDVFEEIISGDVSSISGSDSESDTDGGITSKKDSESNPLMTVSLLQNDLKKNQENIRLDKSNPKIYFVNCLGNLMSIYREVLFGAKEFLKTNIEVESTIENLPGKKDWLILMTGGGHFAGAVFSGHKLVVRKTFHRYTVRAKRGTAQGIRDNKQGGRQPKSAGASLRRHNEAALVQDIQNLLESWTKHVDKCHRIFIRVPNNYKWIFFEGKKPPFKKDDARIRTIPFVTRRATFKELERVHRELSTVEVHDTYLKDIRESNTKETSELSEKARRETKTEAQYLIKESDDKKETAEIEQAEKVNEDDKLDYKISNNPAEKKQNGERHASKKDCMNATKRNESKETQVIPLVWIELYEAIGSGNVEKAKNIIEEVKKQDDERKESICEKLDSDERKLKDFPGDGSGTMNVSKIQDTVGTDKESKIAADMGKGVEVLPTNKQDILNQTFEDYCETALHLASRLAQTDILRCLLEAGADPTVKDLKGRVPFTVAKDKETRNEFRRFMSSYPARFDYRKAQIPSPLTTEMEDERNRKLAEKKKAQAKARKQRLKEKKAIEKQKEEEKIKKEQEDRERNWFQNLSDREKRAVAAERRLGNICFNCSRSLKGLVPFERLSNKYCSTECVQKHRQMLETVVK